MKSQATGTRRDPSACAAIRAMFAKSASLLGGRISSAVLKAIDHPSERQWKESPGSGLGSVG